MHRLAASKGERIVGAEPGRAPAPALGERSIGVAEILVRPPPKAAGVPGDIETALKVFERSSAERLGDTSSEVLLRLLPFLQGAFKRANVDLASEIVNCHFSITKKPEHFVRCVEDRIADRTWL